MNHALFDWDDANILHIAEHDVLPEEAEDVLLGDPVEIDFDEDADELRWSYVGETSSARILQVVVTFRMDTMRVVTAFEPIRRVVMMYLKAKAEENERPKTSQMGE
jgi:uncharacterized DUF497 family protein